VSTPRKPDLDQLVAALTADGQAEELAGRDAALAAFRAASQRGAAAGSSREHRSWSLHRPLAGLPARLAAAGAALIVAASAAAYAQVLPGPVQELAHTVFAPLGVPEGQRHPGQSPAGTVPGAGPTSITIANTGGESACPCPGTSAKTPSPRPAGAYLVTVGVARARVPVNAVVVFTGRVTESGRGAAGVRVRLFERIAGTATEELAGTGVTGPRGGFRLVSPPLTATAVFRVTGPEAAHSAAIRVVAVAAR
jgi:hypothetical protein